MNTAKLVNSALTGGGLIYPENLNVIIGNEDHGYPKGYVLDANAVSSLSGGTGNVSSQQNNPFLKNLTTFSNNLKRGYQLSWCDDYKCNNNLILLSGLKNQFNGNSFGFANIIQGNRVISVGNTSQLIGYDIMSAGNNNIISSWTSVDSNNPKYTKVDDSNIIVNVDKNSTLYDLIKKSKLLFKDSEVKDGVNVFNNIDGASAYYFSYTVTDIDDHHIKLTSSDFKNFIKEPTGRLPFFNIYNYNANNIINGTNIFSNGDICIMSGTGIIVDKVFNSAAFGYGLQVSNDTEITVGSYNVSKALTGDDRYVFSVGAGTKDERKNALEIRRNGKVYIQDIGGFNGHNSDTAKTLQQVISDIQNNSHSTTQPVVDNGPWDIDITSKFANGNVTIKPLSQWSINPAYKRVYFEADLKQGDVITIPDSLRMYIGWKISDNRFGMADWTAAGKKYTVTTDSKYVILVANLQDEPGVQTDTLSSFGKIMLHTSNTAFKPNSGSGSQTPGTTQTVVIPKDHTIDDRVMRSIAHQGYHATERANSLAAFRAAAKEGWQYVETDIYKTSDNNWVVGHDAWMPEGYTNGTITIASGDHSYKYEEHTLAEIKAFTSPDNNKVATLQEFCKVCKAGGLHPYIEIKNPNMGGKQTGVGDKYDNKPYVHKALDIIRREGLGKNFTIISSGNWNLEETVKYDNNIRVGYINVFEMYNVGTDVNKKYWDTVTLNLTKIINAGMGRAVYLFLDQNLTHVATCPTENMDWLMDKKIALEVWTAKTANDLDNLDPYITGVTCDNIHAGEILAKKI